MSQKNIVCPKCGAEPEENFDLFCSQCGEDLRPLHDIECYTCGYSCMGGHREGLNFCPQCGKALQKTTLQPD